MTRLFAITVLLGALVGCGGETSTSTTPPADPPADPATKEGSGKKDEGSSTVSIPFNTESLPTLALLVPKIHCEGCAAGVSQTLAEVEGVKDVTVDVETKVATVAIDEAVFDADAAISALAEAAFPESTVQTEGDAAVDAPQDAS